MLTYYRALWRQVRKDIRHFFSHLWWEIALVLSVFLFKIGPLDIREALEKGAIALLLISIVYLFFISPANLHKDLLSRIASLEGAKGTRSNLKTQVPQREGTALLELENLGARINDLRATLEVIEAHSTNPSSYGTHLLEDAAGISLNKGESRSVEIATITQTLSVHLITWTFKREDKPWSINLEPRTKAVVKVRVTCEPEVEGGLIEWQFIFTGKDFQAEQLR